MLKKYLKVFFLCLISLGLVGGLSYLTLTSIYKQYTYPFEDIEFSMARYYANELDKANITLDFDFAEFKSDGARERLIVAKIKELAKESKFEEAEQLLETLRSSLNKQIAKSYISAFGFLKLNKLPDFSASKLSRALFYATLYINNGNIAYFNKSIEIALELSSTNKRILAYILTDDFINAGKFVENLQYWEKVDLRAYNIKLVDSYLALTSDGVPKSIANRCGGRLRFFVPTMQEYEAGKITKEEAQKKIDDLIEYWSDEKRWKYVIIYGLKEISSFVAEISGVDKAKELLKAFYDDNSDKGAMSSHYIISQKKNEIARALVRLGDIEAAQEIAFSEASLKNRLEIFNSILDELARRDFAEALAYYKKISTFEYRLKLYYDKVVYER